MVKVCSFVYYSSETTGLSPTLTRASTQKRRKPEVKADREVERAVIQHTVEFTAPRGSDDDEVAGRANEFKFSFKSRGRFAL